MDLFEIFYGMYLLLCTILLPLWVFFKRGQKLLSFALCCIPALFAYWLYSYLASPQVEEDHGIAVAGLFFTIPLLSFFCQFVLYTANKAVIKMKKNSNEQK